MSETEILLALHRLSGPVLDQVFLFSHAIGTFWFFSPLVLAVAAWHLRRGERVEARLWVGLGLLTFGLQELLKVAFARSRPDLWPQLVELHTCSFPSGHALASATFYPLLGWVFTRERPRLRPLAMCLALAVVAFVGLGRLYLGVHWPTDVLGGWALGALQSGLAIAWLGARDRGPLTRKPSRTGGAPTP